MSGPGGDERTPDLTAAVLGFRIWNVAADGRLGAVVAGTFWKPGRNEAVCSPFLAESRRSHAAPHPGCNCGFNAYLSHSPKLKTDTTTALGTIGAWGELDVYADGFRAQYAQVLALALPPDGPGSTGARERLERAAEMYGVPLVAVENLRAESLRHASPVDESLKPDPDADSAPAPPRWRPPKRTAPQPAANQPSAGQPLRPVVSVASWKRARGHAIWVRRHATVNASATGVEIGLAPGAAAVADPAPEVEVAAIGARVEAGDCVATVTSAYPAHVIYLCTPVGGTVRGHNTAFRSDLRDGDRAISSAPWLVELDPDDSPLEDAPLLWGRPGVELYRRGVAKQSDADVLTEVRISPAFPRDDFVRLASSGPAAAPILAPHQRTTTTLSPDRGRRAAIMVEHLRPLLQACGEEGSLLAA